MNAPSIRPTLLKNYVLRGRTRNRNFRAASFMAVTPGHSQVTAQARNTTLPPRFLSQPDQVPTFAQKF